MIRVTGRENLHTVDSYDNIGLGLFCCACRHYGVVTADALKKRFKTRTLRADMTELRRIGFRCGQCQRRGTGLDGAWMIYVFGNPGEIENFLKGTYDWPADLEAARREEERYRHPYNTGAR